MRCWRAYWWRQGSTGWIPWITWHRCWRLVLSLHPWGLSDRPG